MSYSKLDNVRLSRDPLRNTIDFESGLGGKASGTPEGIPFVVLEFINSAKEAEPMKATRLYLAHDMKWPGLSPRELLEYLGREVPGNFVSLKVLPYLSENTKGNMFLSSTYTTFIMPHENQLHVFASLGYTVVGDDGKILAKAIREPLYE